ncbi:MAG: hypothetical protein O3A85_14715 [Proteobacteria bacterium]|nr:hypothetical protein [Pseudomonadota bacterium]
MVNVKINKTLTALALGLAISLTSAFSAIANEDSYFDSGHGFATEVGSPVEEASVPSNIQEAMEIN